jgi:membrane protein YqaA with SNARE-associated domain
MLRKHLIQTIVGIVAFALLMAALGLWFERELVLATGWVHEHIGFAGLCGVLLVTDALIMPFASDLLLVVVATTDLAQRGLLHVLVLGVVSSLAGVIGWAIGRWLGHLRFAQRWLLPFQEQHRPLFRHYAFWVIGLGAATPMPFSITSWAAGALGIRWTTVFAAALLFRIPRFVVYYWLILSTGRWSGSSGG